MGARAPVCLIVDDEQVDCMMMRRILTTQHPPPVVRTASTLAEARRHLADEPVSLLFLDNMLPDGVGADFLSELSDRAEWRQVPVVMVSDWPSPFMYAKARAANVLAIWSKEDFTAERVRRLVRNHARLH
ncbi:response regulator [Pseudooceanicola sp.]|jgi:DNA-binding NarL/FixJ family response regulator|uniref:response regulator n=1 Tax=Pseudooceanicola sp. TaxID=1914328 RepID=UPI0040580A73